MDPINLAFTRVLDEYILAVTQGADEYKKWLESDYKNPIKVQLLGIFDQVVMMKNSNFDPDDKLFDLDDYYDSTDFQAIKEFQFGNQTFSEPVYDLYGRILFYSPTVLDDADQSTYKHFFSGYAAKLIGYEGAIFALVQFIKTQSAKAEFAQLPLELRIEYLEQLGNIIATNTYGRTYLDEFWNKQLQANEAPPFFHVSILSELEQKLDDSISRGDVKNGISLSTQILKFLLVVLPQNAAVDDFTKTAIRVNVTNILLKSIRVFDPSFSISSLEGSNNLNDTFGDIDSTLNFLFDVQVHLAIEEGRLANTFASNTLLAGLKIESFDDIFNRIGLVLNLWGIIENTIKLTDPSTTAEQKQQLALQITLGTVELMGTIDELTKISEKLIKSPVAKQSFKFATKAVAVIGIAWSFYDAVDNFQKNDYSVAAGHGLNAVGAVLLLIPTPWTIAIGAALMIVGTVMVIFTVDALSEKWFQYNYFGNDWDQVGNGSIGKTPIEIPFRFDTEPTRQIEVFDSFLHSPNIQYAKLAHFNNDYDVLEIKLDAPSFIAKTIIIDVSFWQSQSTAPWGDFFWTTPSPILVDVSNEGITNSMTQGSFFNSGTDVIFKSQTLQTTKVTIQGLDYARDITSYECKLLVKKNFIGNINFDIIEVLFMLMDNQNNPKMNLRQAIEIS